MIIQVLFGHQILTDPIDTAKLMYENTTRMELEGNYYDLIQGYNHGIHIPTNGAGSRQEGNQRDMEV